MTLATDTKRRALLKLGFRESFTEDSLTARYESSRRPPEGLDLMPGELADQLLATWEEHQARVYVVRSGGIPIAWAVVREAGDDRLVVPRYHYPRPVTERHQSLVRQA